MGAVLCVALSFSLSCDWKVFVTVTDGLPATDNLEEKVLHSRKGMAAGGKT